MTDPAQTPSLRFTGIEDVFAAMRAQGQRVTTPCRLVLEALFSAEGPISAQHITQNTPLLASEPSSVYRNLERFENLGVVAHVHLGHGPSLYMLVGSGEKEFLVCQRCNSVTSVDPAELDLVRKRIETQFGYRASFAHFPIVGLCGGCASAEHYPAEVGFQDDQCEHSHGDYVHSHPPPTAAGHAHTHNR